MASPMRTASPDGAPSTAAGEAPSARYEFKTPSELAMPKFEKSPQWLVDLFDRQIADLPAERRLMFGYPAAFANGQLACGLFGDGMMVRLPDDERARLLALPGAQVFDPMGGRPMKEYALLPPDLLEDEVAVHGWMEKAVAYAATLPPKVGDRGEAKAARKPKPVARAKGAGAGAKKARAR